MLAALAAATASVCSGCAGGGSPGPERSEREKTLERLPQARGATGDPTLPAAVIAGTTVDRKELAPLLAEAAGRTVLEEVALDRLLMRELRDRGVTISNADLDRERETLTRTAARAASLTPQEADEALLRIQRARGLGPKRLAALLWRSAALRALTRDDVLVSELDRTRAIEVAFGARHVARVAVFSTPSEASSFATPLRSLSGAGLVVAFAEGARTRSIDPSADSGGLIGEVSLSDASVPEVVRTTLRGLKALDAGGDGSTAMSTSVAVDGGYAVLLLESVRPARATPSPSELAAVEEDLRVGQQRLAMQRLADQLLASAEVTVFDEDLRWAWLSANRSQRSSGER
ncbi:MAG: hypothetical protein SFZ23_03725 [Planctomycetota bacterium]|nr:hypothetical protein [Planctomycetota bacterium]